MPQVAVALGAAYCAQELWQPPGPRPDDDFGKREQQSRAAVEIAWTDKSFHQVEVERLIALATALGLSREQAADIERRVMGEFKEVILDRQMPPRPVLPAVEFIHGWSTDRVQALQRATAEALGRPVVFRERLRDGSQGPEMVMIPAGRFTMGSPQSEPGRFDSEGPQHEVRIAKPFALGRYALTFEEYDHYCAAVGREKSGDQGWGRGRRPVINVSWEDVVAYCRWLSEQTGKRYRLPTEAEWEYAVRVETMTPFWWGGSISTQQVNYDGSYTYGNGRKGEYRKKTVPVGSFAPNPWGLYQVHGNVWEWVQDVWHGNYQEAPGDGSAWETGGESGRRVVRGGSWGSVPRLVRSAARDSSPAGSRDAGVGFRLAQNL